MCFYIQVTQYLLTPGAFVPRQTRRDLSLRLIEHALVFVMITISTVCSRPMKVTDYLWLLQQRPNLPLIGTRARFCLSAAMMVWVSAAPAGARLLKHSQSESDLSWQTHTHKFRCHSARNVARMHAVCFIEPIWREKKRTRTHTLSAFVPWSPWQLYNGFALIQSQKRFRSIYSGGERLVPGFF